MKIKLPQKLPLSNATEAPSDQGLHCLLIENSIEV